MAYYEIPGEMWVILTLPVHRMNTTHTHTHTHSPSISRSLYMSDKRATPLFSEVTCIYSCACVSLLIAAVLVFTAVFLRSGLTPSPGGFLSPRSAAVPPRQDTLTL